VEVNRMVWSDEVGRWSDEAMQIGCSKVPDHRGRRLSHSWKGYQNRTINIPRIVYLYIEAVDRVVPRILHCGEPARPKGVWATGSGTFHQACLEVDVHELEHNGTKFYIKIDRGLCYKI
jgi:hypothetical protein